MSMWRVKTVTKFKKTFFPTLIYWNDIEIHLGFQHSYLVHPPIYTSSTSGSRGRSSSLIISIARPRYSSYKSSCSVCGWSGQQYYLLSKEFAWMQNITINPVFFLISLLFNTFCTCTTLAPFWFIHITHTWLWFSINRIWHHSCLFTAYQLYFSYYFPWRQKSYISGRQTQNPYISIWSEIRLKM